MKRTDAAIVDEEARNYEATGCVAAPPGSRSIDPASRPGRYYSRWVETPPEVAVSLLAERACLNEVGVVRDDVVGGALQVEPIIRSRLRRSREL